MIVTDEPIAGGFFGRLGAHRPPALSSTQSAEANQVECGTGNMRLLVGFPVTDQPGAGQTADGFGPAEQLLNLLAAPLAEFVAGGFRAATHSRANLDALFMLFSVAFCFPADHAVFDRHVGRDVTPLQRLKERRLLVSFVGSDRFGSDLEPFFDPVDQ